MKTETPMEHVMSHLENFLSEMEREMYDLTEFEQELDDFTCSSSGRKSMGITLIDLISEIENEQDKRKAKQYGEKVVEALHEQADHLLRYVELTDRLYAKLKILERVHEDVSEQLAMCDNPENRKEI